MTAKYAIPTIGGMFASSDHERFLSGTVDHGFETFFPAEVRGKVRNLYQTGVDALAAILRDLAQDQAMIRIWTAENFCRESLQRLSQKLDQELEFQFFRSAEDFQKIRSKDVLLYLHFNRFDPVSCQTIHKVQAHTGATVIEDFVQAPLDIARFSGDFAINSLRKFSSVDVAVAYELDSRPKTAHISAYRTLRKEAESVKSEFLNRPSETLEQLFLKLSHESELALCVPEITSANPSEIDRATVFDFHLVQSMRRINHRTLADRIHDQIPEMKILPGDYMYLMVETPDRDEFRADLFANRVFPVIHWADSECESVKSLLSFHVDQRYMPSDMDRIATLLIQIRDKLKRTSI